MERGFPGIIERVISTLSAISGVAVTFVMCITVLDVLLRGAGRPIVGTYDIVCMSGVFIVGFAFPFTSLMGGHIRLEFLVNKLPGKISRIFNTTTRIACALLFVVIAVNLFRVAARLNRLGEVSITLKLPIYPFAYVLGICCLIQVLVFISDIIKLWEREHE